MKLIKCDGCGLEADSFAGFHTFKYSIQDKVYEIHACYKCNAIIRQSVTNTILSTVSELNDEHNYLYVRKEGRLHAVNKERISRNLTEARDEINGY